MNELKKRNPSLKTILGVGGWNMKSHAFSIMVHDNDKRQRFIFDTIKYITYDIVSMFARKFSSFCFRLVFFIDIISMD